MKTASKIIKKLSPLKVALCKLPPIKDGFFDRSKNNENLEKHYEHAETELSGVFDIGVVFFWTLYWKRKISAMMEYTHQSVMVYLNLSEIFKSSTCILGLRCQKLRWNRELSTEILEKTLMTMMASIFLVSIQKKHFYLQLIISLADGLLKYRTMQLFLLFLIFFIFSLLMRRDSHTELLTSNIPTNLMFVIFLKQLIHIFLYSS